MKKLFLGIAAIVVMMAIVVTGCPNPTTDDEPDFSGVLYEDGFSPKLADPQYWNVDESIMTDEERARGFVTGPDTTVFKNGTESFKVDWSQATDWMGLALHVGSGTTISGTVDLSGYTALTFWAKADGSDAEIDEFGFGADDDKMFTNGEKYKTSIKNITVPSADWKKFIIPLPNPAKLSTVNSLFYVTDGANGGTIYLDDIKFEKLSNVAIKTFDYTGNILDVVTAGTANIGDLSAVFTDGTDNITVSFENLAAHVSWASDKPAVATVDNDGKITGVATGSAIITGTLGGKTVTINVTVGQAVTFTGVLFDDALQGGFSINKDAHNGADKITIDSAASVDSRTAIQVSLASDAGDWGGYFFERSSGVDISGKTLQFSIFKSSLDTAPITKLGVKLQDTQGAWPASDHFFEIDLFAPNFTKTENGNWYEFSIPVAAFNNNAFDAADFNVLGFWNPKKDDGSGNDVPATGDFVFDDIQFVTTTATTYTVTYNANNADGGTLSKATDTVNDGQTVSAAPTGITRTGYTLSGWNTQSDGNGDAFVFGTTAVTTDITLYAKWTMAVVDSVDNRYYFLGDAAGVGTPEIESSGMTHFGGYDGTITFTEEASGGADGTSGYFKLVGTEAQSWAAGGWGNGPYIDFTGYDTLVFWAKAPGTPAVNKTAATQLKFILTSRHRTSGDIGGPIIARPATGTFTTTWTKYEIPLTEITSDANFMQEAIKEFKYELLGNNHELDLDEVYLKSNGNAPTLDVTAPATHSKAIGENPIADTVLEEIAKLTTVTAGATLSYSITTQSVSGAMSIDSNTGELKVADGTKFVYATNTQLTATVQITAADGVSANDTADIAVTIDITAAPPDAPTAPTASAADVINLYSETYDGTAATQINVTNWNPGWGQATVYSEETIAGNKVNKYSNLNYQGIEITSVDVSGKTKVHFDLWTADETSFIFYLISPGPEQHGVTKNPTLNTWNSYDINLSEYTTGNASLDLADLFQIKIEGSGGKTVYIDNIYFY